MNGIFWALFGPLFYLVAGVGFAYVATVIAMREPDWDSGSYGSIGRGIVLLFSIFWPLTIFGLAPIVGITLAVQKHDRERLKAAEIARLEAEVFGP